MGDYNKEEIFSKRVRAGKRTYFFDVKETRSSDYYITITESTKKSEDGMYDKHKLFLYKEDFNKFSDAFNETMNYVKEELLPEYDFDEYSRDSDTETTLPAEG